MWALFSLKPKRDSKFIEGADGDSGAGRSESAKADKAAFDRLG